jgi:predicted transcriptional regulator
MNKLLAYAVAQTELLPEKEQERLANILLEEAKRAAVQEAIKAADEGRTVPHDKVKEYLQSWGTDKELPPPA